MISKNNVFLSLKITFASANSKDLDELLHHAAFHLGLRCLPKYLFRGFWSSKGPYWANLPKKRSIYNAKFLVGPQQQGISEPIFYGDLVYKFRRIVGKPNFSDQFKKIVKHYIRVGYNLTITNQAI